MDAQPAKTVIYVRSSLKNIFQSQKVIHRIKTKHKQKNEEKLDKNRKHRLLCVKFYLKKTSRSKSCSLHKTKREGQKQPQLSLCGY